MNFISDTNKELHIEYLRLLKLRLSVFEKTYGAQGKGLAEISALRIAQDEREKMKRLKCEIIAHECYFSSFSEGYCRCCAAERAYGSVPNFLYELSLAANAVDSGFLLVFLDNRGKLTHYAGADYASAVLKNEPILAVDLCEHAYFHDYYFDRERYVKNAILGLDLTKIEKYVENIKK